MEALAYTRQANSGMRLQTTWLKLRDIASGLLRNDIDSRCYVLLTLRTISRPAGTHLQVWRGTFSHSGRSEYRGLVDQPPRAVRTETLSVHISIGYFGPRLSPKMLRQIALSDSDPGNWQFAQRAGSSFPFRLQIAIRAGNARYAENAL